MKIPYVVSMITRETYMTAPIMLASAPEGRRKIKAENLEWDENLTPKPLSLLAAIALSRNFTLVNPLNDILQKDVDILMDLYPSSIPLKYSVPLIKDEQYWKRCFEEKFPSRKELGHVYWKGKYLSTVLQDYLENRNPDTFIEEEASVLAKLLAPYTYFLRLNQLQMVRQPNPPIPNYNIVQDTCPYSVPRLYHHIPLQPVLVNLFNLEEISIIFAKNNLEENYHPRYFEFSLEDCESLCKGLEHLNHIKIFRINRSNLDCQKVKYILEQLFKKDSIEELDFNHCKIGDYGMKALGGFILLHKNLKRVRVANNRFKEEGVQGIAYALQMKPAAPIELLDVSLNPMTLECATMFAAALVRCKEKPQTLMVNSCGFHGASAVKITGILGLNRGLLRLELCSNDLSGDAEQVLIEALQRNRNILEIDLRRTRISPETLETVQQLLKRNLDMIGQEREPIDIIPPLYLNEPEYLIWEYNPNNPDYIPGRYPERVAEV